MTVAVFGNRFQDSHVSQLKSFFDAIVDLAPGWHLMIDRDFMEYLRSQSINPPNSEPLCDSCLEKADIAFSFGGDGTFLRSARRIGSLEVPIIGINMGHLGYLAAVSPADPFRVVTRILSGDYSVSIRSMLQVSLYDSNHPEGWRKLGVALNEVALLRQETASTVTVKAWLNGQLLADYRADGLIVATPTGSTGYNLSVGGPILAPGTGVWAVSPIAAHTLTMRPLVVADSSELEIMIESRTNHFLLSFDGDSTILPSGSRLRVERAPYITRMVVGRSHSFVDSLREKLLWGAG